MSPKFIIRIFYQFDKRYQQSPRMRSQSDQTFEQNSRKGVGALAKSFEARSMLIYLVICSCMASELASANKYNNVQLK